MEQIVTALNILDCRYEFRVGNVNPKRFSSLDEADDDDDPEYNFLEDLDEPDTEDFRTDRAVRITSESVLMNPTVVCVMFIFCVLCRFSEGMFTVHLS